MVYTRKRPYRHRRRRYKRAHSKRWWRPQWRGPRHKHPRYQVIRTRRPVHYTKIYIRGWEPCAINGTFFSWNGQSFDLGHAIKNNWQSNWFKNYVEDKPQNQKWENFCGGWGIATFSLYYLNKRCEYGFAESSHKFDDWDQVKWKSATFYPVKLQDLDWVIYYDTHFSAKDNDYEARKSWCNGLHLMLKPGKVFVPNVKRKQGTFKRKRVRPPPTLENVWFDKAFFNQVKLVSYAFSSIQLENPIGIPEGSSAYAAHYKNDWFAQRKPCWQNRTSYNQEFTKQEKKSESIQEWIKDWFKTALSTVFGDKQAQSTQPKQAPFTPPFYPSKTLECMSFFYNFVFLVSGSTFQGRLPGSTSTEINPPESCTQSCRTCIRQEDLNSEGDISSQKFRELTRSSDSEELENTSEGEESCEDEQEEENSFRTWLQRYFTGI